MKDLLSVLKKYNVNDLTMYEKNLSKSQKQTLINLLSNEKLAKVYLKLRKIKDSDKKAEIFNQNLIEIDNRDFTLEECAILLGITRERVRQIENSAIKKMRNISNLKKLKDC